MCVCVCARARVRVSVFAETTLKVCYQPAPDLLPCTSHACILIRAFCSVVSGIGGLSLCLPVLLCVHPSSRVRGYPSPLAVTPQGASPSACSALPVHRYLLASAMVAVLFEFYRTNHMKLLHKYYDRQVRCACLTRRLCWCAAVLNIPSVCCLPDDGTHCCI